MLLVDACRNDPQSQLGRAAGAVELEAVGRPQVAPPPGIVAFYSCSRDEIAYEHPTLNHGVFFHYIIDGLAGKADADRDETVTVPELQLYAVKQVQTFVRTELGKLQTPELKGEIKGLMPLARVAGLAPDVPPTPAVAPAAPANLKEIMKRANETMLVRIGEMGQEVRDQKVSWVAYEKQVAEYAETIRRMTKYKPPRGAETQYNILAQQYLLQVGVLETAAKDHDPTAADRAIRNMRQQCAGCHQLHK